MDNWKHRSQGMKCNTCIWFVVKNLPSDESNGNSKAECGTCKAPDPRGKLGRCRRHAPSANGFVPVFESDWCGDHRLDENKI